MNYKQIRAAIRAKRDSPCIEHFTFGALNSFTWNFSVFLHQFGHKTLSPGLNRDIIPLHHFKDNIIFACEFISFDRVMLQELAYHTFNYEESPQFGWHRLVCCWVGSTIRPLKNLLNSSEICFVWIESLRLIALSNEFLYSMNLFISAPNSHP